MLSPPVILPGATAATVDRSRASSVDPQRMMVVALGALWLLDGCLQLQPYMFRQTFVTGIIAPAEVGQPWIIGKSMSLAGKLIADDVAAFNAGAAITQLLIGATLLYRPTVRLGLVASVAWSMVVWWIGEGFGGLLTGSASPLTGAPGAVILYAVLALVLYPDGRADGDCIAADGWLGLRRTRRVWAAIWLCAAVLWLLPANCSSDALQRTITSAPAGAGWLASLQSAVASAVSGRGAAIALVLALCSAMIGVAAFRPRLRRPGLALAGALSLGYWLIGQGLGGVFTGTATDLNTGPLFALLAATLYPARGSRECGDLAGGCP